MIFFSEKIIDFFECVFDDLNKKPIIYDELENSDYKNKKEIN